MVETDGAEDLKRIPSVAAVCNRAAIQIQVGICEMGVSDRIREIENEIDGNIRARPTWQRSKSAVLTDLMQTYRDRIEAIFLVHFFFRVDPKAVDVSAADLGSLFAQENCVRSGILWALKWASEFCPENGLTTGVAPDELAELLSLGATCEVFVDALKCAKGDLAVIHADEESRTLICYEGEQATAFDPSIVHRQRITVPISRHVSLTEDTDQITSRWTAGNYRRVIRSLAACAAGKESTITVAKSEVSIPQPTLIWFDRPSRPPDCEVFDDLVLPPVIDDSLKWHMVALLDTPIVKIGQKYCALSSDLKAISEIDDHMLRLAARLDADQYSMATLLREDRMINRCKKVFEQHSQPWSVESRVQFSDPPQEADIRCIRDADSIALELKSTLRPETPWEVSMRNKDIISGIRQAKALVDRGVAKRGYVITNGYRGDYACWAEALSHDIPIGTLNDLEAIASDPATVVSTLMARVGITAGSSAPRERLPDREAALGGWKLRLVDTKAPESH
jgi:hypothetical protein